MQESPPNWFLSGLVLLILTINLEFLKYYRKKLSIWHRSPAPEKKEVHITYDGPERGEIGATNPDNASDKNIKLI